MSEKPFFAAGAGLCSLLLVIIAGGYPRLIAIVYGYTILWLALSNPKRFLTKSKKWQYRNVRASAPTFRALTPRAFSS
jgi:hypothetical protein